MLAATVLHALPPVVTCEKRHVRVVARFGDHMGSLHHSCLCCLANLAQDQIGTRSKLRVMRTAYAGKMHV